MRIRRLFSAERLPLRHAEPFSLAGLLTALALAALMAAMILLRAYANGDGYLSPDSKSYLALAENLRLGHGFHMANDGRGHARADWFAIWPVGYPLLIRGAELISGAGEFLASKLVSVAALLAIAAMLGRAFGRHGGIAVLVLGFAGSFEILSFSWSEVPFTTFALAAALLLAPLIAREPPQRGALRACGLAACCLGLFLSRYIGAFSLVLPVLAAMAAWLRGERRLALLCAGLAVLLMGLVEAYLHHNAVLTGYGTGMPREGPRDTPGARAAMLGLAIWRALVVPLVEFQGWRWGHWLVAAAELAGLLWVWRVWRAHRQAHPGDALSVALVLTGGIYLAAIVVMRWVSQFDPYNFRLLGPGTLLLTLALLRRALVTAPGAARAIGLYVAALATVALAQIGHEIVEPDNPDYTENVETLAQRYAALPQGAIVLFGNQHLLYLRPDLYLAWPYCHPWFDDEEEWPDFLRELDHSRPIYLDMTGPALGARRCPASIRAFLARQHPGELRRLGSAELDPDDD